jgi:hypothetical protein
MTFHSALPTGSTAADLLAWWRQRARTDRIATGYYTTCRDALAEFGSEAQLRRIDALKLHADDLARQAVNGCWAGLSEPSRHHQALRLRRALGLFGAAFRMCSGTPLTIPHPVARPAPGSSAADMMDSAGNYDSAGIAPELIAYLISDEAVLSAATTVCDAAGLVAATTSSENLAVLSAAISELETALAEAGIGSERIPATAAALTAYTHRHRKFL